MWKRDRLTLKDEARLLVALRKRDERALDELMDLAAGFWLVLATAILQSQSDAEEVVQDVIFEFWKANKADKVKSGLVAYITGAVKLKCLHVFRRRNTHAESATTSLNDADWAALPENFDGESEILFSVMQYIQKELPERQRQVMSYRVAGYSNPEIAGKLGISEKAVEKNITRALQALRSEFAGISMEAINPELGPS